MTTTINVFHKFTNSDFSTIQISIHNFFGIKPVSARQLSALGETLKFHEYTIP